MLFYVIFVVSPPGWFGLPDPSRIVIPSTQTGIHSAAFSEVSNAMVGHGTLSEFRRADEALTIAKTREGITISLRDNFVTVELSAVSASDAFDRARLHISMMCGILSLKHREQFSYSLQAVEDEAGQCHRPEVQDPSTILRATWYKLSNLKANIEQAIDWVGQKDEKLYRALIYSDHAFSLESLAINMRGKPAQSAMTQALAFLQLFKALTVILGDPSMDKDHQNRFRTLGFPSDFWQVNVKPLYRVRCDQDVAHYSMTTPNVEDFKVHFDQAVDLLHRVITAHTQTYSRAPRTGA